MNVVSDGIDLTGGGKRPSDVDGGDLSRIVTISKKKDPEFTAPGILCPGVRSSLGHLCNKRYLFVKK